MFKEKEISNLHLEPTTSRIANLVPSSPYPKPYLASSPPSLTPPPLPPRNSNMTLSKHSSNSLESRSGTLGTVKVANQHSSPSSIARPSGNEFHHNKLKIALKIAVLTLVMITVPSVYISVTYQKTEIPNINQSILTKMTEVPIDIQMTEAPTANNQLTFNGMSIIFIPNLVNSEQIQSAAYTNSMETVILVVH